MDNYEKPLMVFAKDGRPITKDEFVINILIEISKRLTEIEKRLPPLSTGKP